MTSLPGGYNIGEVMADGKTSRKFHKPGTIAKPGPVGRGWRIVNGFLTLAVLAWILSSYEIFVRSEAPGLLASILISLGVLASFSNINELVNVGFTRAWGARPQAVVAILCLSAIAIDLFYYGKVWGPPLGIFSFLLLVYDFAHVGMSYVISGIFAVPG